MPKVLRIINRLNLGGPVYNAGYLTRYLSPEFETILLAGMKDKTEAGAEFILEGLGVKPYYITGMRRSINPWMDYRAYRKVKEIILSFRPDIVHTHASKAGAIGRLAAIHCGVKVIVHTFHGHTFHSYFNNPITAGFMAAERYLAGKTNAIIAISKSQKEDLGSRYRIADPGKIEVIPLGFDLGRFSGETGEKRKKFRKQWGLGDGIVAIGIIGRLVPVKNHALFIDAVARLNKGTFRAFVIGDGELRVSLEKRAVSKGLVLSGNSPDLVFTSWLREVDEVMQGLDIVALTSLNEGTPVSLIEAQAASLPIVATDVGGVADTVGGGAGLLSPSGDVGALTRNISALMKNETLRQEMGTKGYYFVKERFSYARLIEDMRKLYNRLLS